MPHPSPTQLDAIRALGASQRARSAEEEGFPTDATFFEFKGMLIVDPFMDEAGLREVDPIAHYGDAFLNSDFMQEPQPCPISPSPGYADNVQGIPRKFELLLPIYGPGHDAVADAIELVDMVRPHVGRGRTVDVTRSGKKDCNRADIVSFKGDPRDLLAIAVCYHSQADGKLLVGDALQLVRHDHKELWDAVASMEDPGGM